MVKAHHPLKPGEEEIFVGPDRIRVIVDSGEEKARWMKAHDALMEKAAAEQQPPPDPPSKKKAG